MEPKIAFGKFIVGKRRAKGMTQAELAQRLYVTESAVSKWERGVSYPDITLVTALGEALGVSEHELVTASDDVGRRREERQARRYRRLRTGYLLATSILYGAALVACFLCDLAINRGLGWFWIVLASCAMAFSLTNLPVLVPRRKGLCTLGAFFATLNLLLLVCCLFTGGRWFPVAFAALAFGFCVVFAPLVLRGIVLPRRFCRHKALLSMAADTLLLFLLLLASCWYQNELSSLFYPVGTLSLFLLLLPWSLLLCIRYLPLRAPFRAALCLVFGGVFFFLSNSVPNWITEGKPFRWPAVNLGDWSFSYLNGNILAVITLDCFLAALVLVCCGAFGKRRAKAAGRADR